MLAKHFGFDLQGQRVKVHDAVERLWILIGHPLFHGAQVVTNVHGARWLDAGEYSHRSIVDELFHPKVWSSSLDP